VIPTTSLITRPSLHSLTLRHHALAAAQMQKKPFSSNSWGAPPTPPTLPNLLENALIPCRFRSVGGVGGIGRRAIPLPRIKGVELAGTAVCSGTTGIWLLRDHHAVRLPIQSALDLRMDLNAYRQSGTSRTDDSETHDFLSSQPT
jgi:hypothetical protein